MNGRLRARASTAGGKIVGKLLERRTSACLFRASFSSCHLDTRSHRRGHYFIELVKSLSLLETWKEIIVSVKGSLVHRVRRWVALRGALLAAAALVATVRADAQESKSPPEGRVIVVGEGSITVPPDYVQIRSGVTTTAKTVKEATDANTKLMAAVMATLLDSGIAQKDIQTSRFSIQPVYVPQTPSSEPKVSGYRVSNQVNVTIRQISRVGDPR
jgi:hypothetical protein